MNTKIRNHVSTICMQFVKKNFPDEYKTIVDLARVNYAHGEPTYVASTVLRQMEEIIAKRQITEVV